MLKLKYSIIFSLLLVGGFIRAQEHSYAARMAGVAMGLWNDTMDVSLPNSTKWTCEQTLVLTGMENLWYATADRRYFDFIQSCMDKLVIETGNTDTNKFEDSSDQISAGRALLLLYQVTGKEKYLQIIRKSRKQLSEHQRTYEKDSMLKSSNTTQWKVEDLYVTQPFYCEYAREFHEKEAYSDIARIFLNNQPEDHLSVNSPSFLASAIGLYVMALVDVLETFPENHPQRQELVQVLDHFAKVIRHFQDRSTGLWWNIMNNSGKGKNHYDTSASCMFVYTLAKGMRLGILSQNYKTIAEKGYKGVLKSSIGIGNSQIDLLQDPDNSNPNSRPYNNYDSAMHMNRRAVVNRSYSVGAFIQAANEMDLHSTLHLGKGKTIMLDNYFNHELKMDASGAIVPFHYVWDEKDNNGYSLFGFVFRKFGVHTATLSSAPFQDNLKKADIYLIVDPDNEKETKQPNYIEPTDINAIYQWVNNGGVLLLFGNDSGNVEMKHFNRLAGKFGIQFNLDSRNKVIGDQFDMGTFTVPSGNDIFKTAEKIYIKEYASQTIHHPSKSIFSDGKLIVMSVAKIGKGTVFAVGDPWFYNEYLDGRKLPGTINNYKAAEDLVRWVIKQTGKK